MRKEEIRSIMAMEFMSSDESDEEDGTVVLVRRPLPWLSREATEVLAEQGGNGSPGQPGPEECPADVREIPKDETKTINGRLLYHPPYAFVCTKLELSIYVMYKEYIMNI